MGFKWQEWRDKDYMVLFESVRISPDRVQDKINEVCMSKDYRGYQWDLHTIYTVPYPDGKTVFVFKKRSETKGVEAL